MTRNANFASMSIDELWEIHQEISKLLEAKMLAEKKNEKKIAERQLNSLHPANIDRLKAHRPYPPVVPKFANPDDPSQVWSGRGKQPLGLQKSSHPAACLMGPEGMVSKHRARTYRAGRRRTGSSA